MRYHLLNFLKSVFLKVFYSSSRAGNVLTPSVRPDDTTALSHLFLPLLHYLTHFFPGASPLGSHPKASFLSSVMFLKLNPWLFIKMSQSAHFVPVFFS